MTLREETEWVETIDAGWNTLAGTNVDKIIEATLSANPGRDIDQYGNGHASERIVEMLLDKTRARCLPSPAA